MQEPANKQFKNETAQADYERRFGGIARLYGDDGLQQVKQASVCVIGIGGVGAWVAESLARSGIGAITLIDMDVVVVSNINRQLHALESSVGRDKVAVMAERIGQINALCEVTVIDDFIAPDNFARYIKSNYDYVIDCIDDFRTKAALVNYCRQHKLDILCVGAAGGQIDPSKVRQSDLSRTQHDNLLARTRKLLRQDYGFARNPKRSFGVPCIYSDEQPVFPDGNGGISSQRIANSADEAVSSSALNCGGIGSISHVTATFAMHAAGFVINQIANAK